MMDKTKMFPVATASDVARQAGVSRSAVSRTFTPGCSVSEETRRKVLAAAKDLNYHVNMLARGLSKEDSRPVCILGGKLAQPFQASLLDQLTRQLQLSQRAVMVINTAGGEASANQALKQTLNYRAAATVVLSGTPQASLVEQCVQSGQQVVLVNRLGQFDGVDHVGIDFRHTMSDAYGMLARAQCDNIALISSKIQSPSMVSREQGFLQAAALSGQECSVYQCEATSYEGGARMARQLFARRHRPDGVFCVTDLVACGVIDVARYEFGLRIPEDLCVVGFDDIEQAGWGAYQLTTFAQPLQHMAAAINQLLAPEGRGATSLTQLFTASPVWRKTVRPS